MRPLKDQHNSPWNVSTPREHIVDERVATVVDISCGYLVVSTPSRLEVRLTDVWLGSRTLTTFPPKPHEFGRVQLSGLNLNESTKEEEVRITSAPTRMVTTGGEVRFESAQRLYAWGRPYTAYPSTHEASLVLQARLHHRIVVDIPHLVDRQHVGVMLEEADAPVRHISVTWFEAMEHMMLSALAGESGDDQLHVIIPSHFGKVRTARVVHAMRLTQRTVQLHRACELIATSLPGSTARWMVTIEVSLHGAVLTLMAKNVSTNSYDQVAPHLQRWIPTFRKMALSSQDISHSCDYFGSATIGEEHNYFPATHALDLWIALLAKAAIELRDSHRPARAGSSEVVVCGEAAAYIASKHLAWKIPCFWTTIQGSTQNLQSRLFVKKRYQQYRSGTKGGQTSSQ